MWLAVKSCAYYDRGKKHTQVREKKVNSIHCSSHSCLHLSSQLKIKTNQTKPQSISIETKQHRRSLDWQIVCGVNFVFIFLSSSHETMVKLFALSVFYKDASEARLLKSAYDLQSFSFFQRGSVQEFIGYVSTQCAMTHLCDQ